MSERDRVVRQLVAVEVVRDLLRTAVKKHLPAAHWVVTSGGDVVVQCGQRRPADRAAAFVAWQRAIGGRRMADWTSPLDRATWWQVSAARSLGDTSVTVQLKAEFWPDETLPTTSPQWDGPTGGAPDGDGPQGSGR
jgi:hypothetical protein